MRERIVSMIDREAAIASEDKPARIVMKLNNLVDEAIVDALYRASQAGVQIDLLVRAICALRPGVPGLSESITVHSILGRFLEHSRIYYFANGGDNEVYIGSADMMHRNLDRRVETLVNVEAPDMKRRLLRVLEIGMADRCFAWTLDSHGTWSPVPREDDEPALSLQSELMRNDWHGS
jgi:polyphosphate kinase